LAAIWNVEIRRDRRSHHRDTRALGPSGKWTCGSENAEYVDITKDGVACLERLVNDSGCCRFETTVGQYNRFAVEGHDPEFRRGEDAYQRHLGDADVAPNPCVRPVERPPFYAIAVYAGDLGTARALQRIQAARS
jgi:hypothetical protein